MPDMEINLYEGGIVNLKIYNKKEKNVDLNNRISILNDKQVIKQYSSQDIHYGFQDIIDENYGVSFDGKSLEIFELTSKKTLFSTKQNFIIRKEQEIGLRVDYDVDEVILGLGQDHMGNLDNRNVQRIAWHQNNVNDSSSNSTVPFYLSSKGYGLFINTSYPVRLAFGEPHIPDLPVMADLAPSPFDWFEPLCENQHDSISMLVWDDPILDVFILPGDYQEVIKKYYGITGFPGLLPKWSYGYIQCKNRYKTADELLQIGKTFREKQLPCDCIVIDWKWFEHYGDLEWKKEDFGNIKPVIQELNNLGIQVMQAQHPMIEKKSLKYQKFNSMGLIGYSPDDKTVNFDHFHPKAKEIWWGEIEKFYDEGIRGFWTDMGEPKEDYAGNEMSIGPREKYHNFYTYFWNKNLFEAQTESKKTRPFILARTQSLGIQNFNSALWSSDIGERWDILEKSVVQVQNVCISGQPHWCTDIGGFIPNKQFSPELYVRWHSWGIFCPLYRTHGTRPENEPWSFGKVAEKIIKENLYFRYQLLPYIYAKQKKVAESGTLFIRPCFIDYKERETLNFKLQYMFGDLLVSPIVKPGKRIKETYLPGKHGQIWFDYYTGKKYIGGKVIESISPINRIPLYVRENSIIVKADPELYTKDINQCYYLDIYGDGRSATEIYEDDGVTYKFQNGEYNEFLIETTEMELTIRTANWGYKPKLKERTIIAKLIRNDKDIYEYNFVYKIGEDISISFDEFIKVQEREQPKIDVFVDTLNTLRDGSVHLNILVSNNEALPLKNLKCEIEKPKYYYQESPDGLSESFHLDDHYQKMICFIPIGYKMPQQERITVFIKDEFNHILSQQEVIIGNGFLKNWRINVSNEPLQSNGDLVRSSEFENNPWGYVNLLEMMVIKYMGFKPKELRNYKNIDQGFGKGTVSIYSPNKKQAFLRLKGDTHFKVNLNDTVLFFSETYVPEKLLKVDLNEGENLLEIEASFHAKHAYSGREFGFSVQILDESKMIDEEVLLY